MGKIRQQPTAKEIDEGNLRLPIYKIVRNASGRFDLYRDGVYWMGAPNCAAERKAVLRRLRFNGPWLPVGSAVTNEEWRLVANISPDEELDPFGRV